jgi:hypothetical protein
LLLDQKERRRGELGHMKKKISRARQVREMERLRQRGGTGGSWREGIREIDRKDDKMHAIIELTVQG